MDNFTKREFIRGKINSLSNTDIDELTMVISNMPEKKIKYENQHIRSPL